MNKFFLFLILIFQVIGWTSCGSDSSQTDVPPVLLDTIERPFDSMVKPPPDPAVRPLTLDKARRSVFSQLGCCFQGEVISAESCCCQLVLEKYEEVLKKNDKKAIKSFMTDPILGDCRKKMRVDFDKVDQKYDDDSYDW